jgi:hypothetical protein
MTGLLEALGLMKPGKELSEQIAELPLPDHWQVSPRQQYRRDG